MEVVMKGLVQEFWRRMSMMDCYVFVQSVLIFCGCYLQSYIQVKEVIVGKNGLVEFFYFWEVYCWVIVLYFVVYSFSVEVIYICGVVNLLF